MPGWTRIVATILAVLVFAIGCAPAAPGSSGVAVGNPIPSSPPRVKRITLGMGNEQVLHPNAGAPRRAAVPLVHSGLTVLGDQGVRHPQLVEAVPRLENGLWKILPDGRMETTWKIRDGARWHDGVALTAEDLLFTLQVGRDREMSAFNTLAFGSIEDARAPDPRTLTITWKEPFVDAPAVLDGRPVGPLPKHLLEDAYRGGKASFLDLPYWTSEFVGAGPYRLREWAPGVSMLLEANGEYVLGRPRIDQIEVKFIPDANTLTANLLAGTVDVTNYLGSIDLGIQLRDQWRGGTVAFNFGSEAWVALYPQFVDPRPEIVTDLEVRRALAYAIDRQEIVDTLVAGLSPVPHSLLSPNQAAYRNIEAAVPRYDYDPRRAAQMLEARGYRKGQDGIYYDEANRRLELEVRSGAAEAGAKPASAVADYWRRLGVDATAVRPSPQQTTDVEYVATFPAFLVISGSNDLSALRLLHSSATPLPSNNFRVTSSGNRSRYMNPEFDSLIEAYFKTLPVPERIRVVGQIIRHIADQVTVLGMYYNPTPGAISDRVLNVTREWPLSYITWNAHEWDVTS